MGRAGTHSPGEGGAGKQPVQIPGQDPQDSPERGGGGRAGFQEPVPTAREGGQCAPLLPHTSPVNGWGFFPPSSFTEIQLTHSTV